MIFAFQFTYDKDVEGARATGIYAVFYQGNGADGANRQIIPDNRDKTIPFITASYTTHQELR